MLTREFSAEAVQLGNICSAAGIAGIWSGPDHVTGNLDYIVHALSYSHNLEATPAGEIVLLGYQIEGPSHAIQRAFLDVEDHRSKVHWRDAIEHRPSPYGQSRSVSEFRLGHRIQYCQGHLSPTYILQA